MTKKCHQVASFSALLFLLMFLVSYKISIKDVSYEDLVETLKKNAFVNTVEEPVMEEGRYDRLVEHLKTSEEESRKKILNAPLNATTEAEAKSLFFKSLSFPQQTVCKSLKRVGGVWTKGQCCKEVDGDKFVCMDKILSSESDCLIYSFGINNEWSFEDVMDSIGLYAYDHTIKAGPGRGRNISFFKTGLGIGTNLKRLETIIKENNHTNTVIEYLKVDIEWGEFQTGGFSDWFSSGALQNVNQLAIELHLPRNTVSGYINMLKILQEMFELNFRIISHEVNMVTGADKSGYYNFVEVVFMKT